MDVPTRYPDDVAIAAGAVIAAIVEVSAEKRSKH